MKNGGSEGDFCRLHTPEKRLELARNLCHQNPHTIPVILERRADCTSLPALDHCKLLVSETMDSTALLRIIRDKLRLPDDAQVALFWKGPDGKYRDVASAPSRSALALYDLAKADDNLLYLVYGPPLPRSIDWQTLAIAGAIGTALIGIGWALFSKRRK